MQDGGYKLKSRNRSSVPGIRPSASDRVRYRISGPGNGIPGPMPDSWLILHRSYAVRQGPFQGMGKTQYSTHSRTALPPYCPIAFSKRTDGTVIA